MGDQPATTQAPDPVPVPPPGVFVPGSRVQFPGTTVSLSMTLEFSCVNR